jgi:hypothetical protein
MGGIFVGYSQPLLEGQNLGMKVKELLLTEVLCRVRLCDIPIEGDGLLGLVERGVLHQFPQKPCLSSVLTETMGKKMAYRF